MLSLLNSLFNYGDTVFLWESVSIIVILKYIQDSVAWVFKFYLLLHWWILKIQLFP